MKNLEKTTRIVTVQVSPSISAQGNFLSTDDNGKTLIDAGGRLVRGVLLEQKELDIA